jgi:multiple sugar transport system substrate-binding protein
LPYPTEDWTWPEPFLSICRKLVQYDDKGQVTRFAYCEAYPTQVGNFVYSAGADWVDDASDPKRCTIDSTAFQRAARFRWDLIHIHHVSPSPSQIQTLSGGSGIEDMFLHGRLALMVSGIWHTPRFLQEKGLDFDVVPFPRGPGGKQGWSSGGSGYAICKASRHKAAAWRLIRAILSEENMSAMAATGFLQPALVKLARSDVFLKSPGAEHKSYLFTMTASSHFMPFDPRWNEIQYGLIWPALDAVWNGEKKPEEVLPDLCRRVNEKFYRGR